MPDKQTVDHARQEQPTPHSESTHFHAPPTGPESVDLESASSEVAPKRRRRASTRSPARVTKKARAKAKSAPAKRRTRKTARATTPSEKPAKTRAPRRTSKTKGRATAPKRTVRAKRVSKRAKTK